MPPRIPTSSASSSQALLLNPFSELVISPRLSASSSHHNGLITATANSTFQTHNNSQRQRFSLSKRHFSTTQPRQRLTRQRKQFWQWLETSGAVMRDATKPMNYVKTVAARGTSEDSRDMPFPLNPEFRSQSVLSDEAREIIWKSVVEEGQPIKVVSARYSVDMRRVAAVLRMKAIEKRWKAEGKPLAIPYAKAVQKMLPITQLGQVPHEPINDVHVHSYTMQQVFFPTSESREFTRGDAAKAFGRGIIPVDKKIRIPELIDLEKQLAAGVDRNVAEEDFTKAALKSEQKLKEREANRVRELEEAKTKVDTGRFEFRIENVNVEELVGRDGRSRKAVGWRYGVPFNDRKKGMVKIPTKVE
ncbi:Eukaryotic mitochondrial regulator domain containing protein [Rhypophila decipiens]